MSNLSIYGDTSDAASDNDDDNMTVIEVGTTKMFKSNKNLENTKDSLVTTSCPKKTCQKKTTPKKVVFKVPAEPSRQNENHDRFRYQFRQNTQSAQAHNEAVVEPRAQPARTKTSERNPFNTSKKPMIEGLAELGPLKFQNFCPKRAYEMSEYDNSEARRKVAREGLILKIETKRVYSVEGTPRQAFKGEMTTTDTIPIEWDGRIRTDKKNSISSCYIAKH
ncbi:unnamed protein product [Oikopleura dioica]|uniref:Uncharacterized protein n=1 Tax=Oikopleura dioica TaxID=34765 RepID=E4Y2V2_OIKDI|nr:unnamed protein product [Oikopleura dioica]